MRLFLSKIIDIRQGELKRVAIMAAYSFVIIASYNILKPMTRSLFVSKLGLGQLPYLYMILAVVVGIFVYFYLKISKRLKLIRLLNSTTLVLIASLLFFRWLLIQGIDSPLLYYGLFIWASIYGVLTTTQFWLLANYIFNAREAKRIFPILASSALAGAIMGGYFTSFMVEKIGGTPNLAFFCVALLAVGIIFINSAWQNRDPSQEQAQRNQPASASMQSGKLLVEIFSLVRQSRHLSYLICIVVLTYMVVQIADFQFIAFASNEITDTDKLTKFLGFWLSNLSIFALTFQLLFANIILKRLGVGAMILFLPVALFLTSGWVLINFSLISVLALKVGDGAFRHSINKVGSELLYLPLPTDVKKKTKAFIDMFVDRFARGLAGLVLLFFYTWLGISIAHISIISLILVSLWIAIAVLTYREYVNSFRSAIAKRQIDIDQEPLSIRDETTINTLIVSLASENDRQIAYALKLLKSVDDVEIQPAIKPLLRHKSPDVRFHSLILIYDQKLTDLIPDVKILLEDPDEEVGKEAVRIVAEFSQQPTLDTLDDWLKSDNPKLKNATLKLISSDFYLAREILTKERIEIIMQESPECRARIAAAIGVLNNPSHNKELKKLLHDSDDAVKMEAIKSAGKIRNEEFIPILIAYLDSKSFRKTAREALANYGDKIIKELAAYVSDKKVSLKIRLDAVKVLGLLGSQNAVDELLENISGLDIPVRHQIIKSLNKLRKKYQYLIFDKRVEAALLEELKHYHSVITILNSAEQNSADVGESGGLLRKALKERLEDHLERIFRLLGLLYPAKDIYNAFTAATNSNKTIKANAIEFLDNILTTNHKKLLLPIVEDSISEQVIKNVNRANGQIITNEREAINHLFEGSDLWLIACAIYTVGQKGLVEEFKTQINNAMKSQNQLVSETAQYVLKQFA